MFFVISGLLMTSIVVEGLEAGRFNVWRFYLSRAGRIVPALVVLCVVLLVVGWFALPSFDYRMLGVHSAFSLTFLSNVRFAREAGYFDAASHEKWLLHTWPLYFDDDHLSEFGNRLLVPMFAKILSSHPAP